MKRYDDCILREYSRSMKEKQQELLSIAEQRELKLKNKPQRGSHRHWESKTRHERGGQCSPVKRGTAQCRSTERWSGGQRYTKKSRHGGNKSFSASPKKLRWSKMKRQVSENIHYHYDGYQDGAELYLSNEMLNLTNGKCTTESKARMVKAAEKAGLEIKGLYTHSNHDFRRSNKKMMKKKTKSTTASKSPQKKMNYGCSRNITYNNARAEKYKKMKTSAMAMEYNIRNRQYVDTEAIQPRRRSDQSGLTANPNHFHHRRHQARDRPQYLFSSKQRNRDLQRRRQSEGYRKTENEHKKTSHEMVESCIPDNTMFMPENAMRIPENTKLMPKDVMSMCENSGMLPDNRLLMSQGEESFLTNSSNCSRLISHNNYQNTGGFLSLGLDLSMEDSTLSGFDSSDIAINMDGPTSWLL
eukprot:g934.t1